MTPVVRSTEQIAVAIGRPFEHAREILGECVELGLVERVGVDGWRLTEQAERRHGRHLRYLEATDGTREAA